MKKLILLLSILPILSFAQDFQYSQANSAQLALNPALTGNFDGTVRINLNHRDQWRAVSKAFKTSHISMDAKVGKKWAVGGYILNQSAGDLDFRHTTVMFTGSYAVQFNEENLTKLTFGLQAGGIFQSVNLSNAKFGDQAGGGASQEALNHRGKTIGDLAMGAMFEMGATDRKFTPYLGVAVFHPHEPLEGFDGGEQNILPRKDVLQGGVKFQVNSTWAITPDVIYVRQEGAQMLLPTINARHDAQGNDLGLLFGVGLRKSDALIAKFGVDHNAFIAAISYDYNISELQSATGGRGGIELSFSYILDGKGGQKSTVVPRF